MFSLHLKVWHAVWPLALLVKKADSNSVCGAWVSVPAMLLILGMTLGTAKAKNV